MTDHRKEEDTNLLSLGTRKLTKQDYKGALKIFQKALKANEANSEIIKGMGDAWFGLNQYDKALKYFKQEASENNNDVWYLNSKGLSLFETNNLPKAEKYYKAAVNLDPKFHSAWYNRGLIYEHLGKYNTAIKYYRRAVAVNQDYAKALSAIGFVYEAQGKYEKALNYYQKAIDADPQDVQFWLDKAYFLRSLERFDEAIELLNEALNTTLHSAQLFNNLAVLYIDKTQYEKAEEYLKKAIDMDSNSHWPYNNWGLINLWQANFSKAITLFDKALSIKPNLWTALVNKANAYRSLRKFEEAESIFKEVANNEHSVTDDKDSIVNAHVQLAGIYMDDLPDLTKAIEHVKIALELDPEHIPSRTEYMECMILKGSYEEARDMGYKLIYDVSGKDLYECIFRYFVMTSYILEAHPDKEIKISEFLNYFNSLNDEFHVSDEFYRFDGITDAISKSEISIDQKILLLSFIKFIQLPKKESSFINHLVD